MTAIVVASNILVQFPINDWLTYGAFTYPVTFLVTDLTNRQFGITRAQRIAVVGCVTAVLLSLILATPRIALASGTAFLSAQLVDIAIFEKLRQRVWWMPPLVSSLFASIWDTIVFFTIAFAGTGLPWITWAIGDYCVKVLVACALLVPFRAIARVQKPLASLN